MEQNRRSFLKKGMALGTGLGALPLIGHSMTLPMGQVELFFDTEKYAKIDKAAAKPVLKKELFKNPLIIEEVQLRHYQGNYICTIRTENGAEGLCVSNNLRMNYLYPIFIKQVAPFFNGKDARELDTLLDEVYVYKSNYKLQNYSLWVPVATVEFAILDLLGKLSEKPIGALIDNEPKEKIGVYRANNFRGKSAEESIQLITKQMAETDSKALKFKVGGRMSNNADDPAGRTEKLIPLIRKTFGDDMTVYADSNGNNGLTSQIRF